MQLQIVDSYLVLNPQAPIRIKFTWQAMGAVRGAAYPATYMTRPNDPPGSPSYPIALLVVQSGSYNTNSAYLRSGTTFIHLVHIVLVDPSHRRAHYRMRSLRHRRQVQ